MPSRKEWTFTEEAVVYVTSFLGISVGEYHLDRTESACGTRRKIVRKYFAIPKQIRTEVLGLGSHPQVARHYDIRFDSAKLLLHRCLFWNAVEGYFPELDSVPTDYSKFHEFMLEASYHTWVYSEEFGVECLPQSSGLDFEYAQNDMMDMAGPCQSTWRDDLTQCSAAPVLERESVETCAQDQPLPSDGRDCAEDSLMSCHDECDFGDLEINFDGMDEFVDQLHQEMFVEHSECLSAGHCTKPDSAVTCALSFPTLL